MVISSFTKGSKILLILNELYSCRNHTMQVPYSRKACHSILSAIKNKLDIFNTSYFAEIKVYFDCIKDDGNLTNKIVERLTSREWGIGRL